MNQEQETHLQNRAYLLFAVVIALSACLVGESGDGQDSLSPDFLAAAPVCEDQPEKAAPTHAAPTACCGNGTCEKREDAYTCAKDCARCGDSICSSTESPSSCSADCGTCGNGTCEITEGATSCAKDCALPTYVRVDRVRYCRSWPFCNGATSYPDYNAWKFAGVNNDHQKLTYLTKVKEPKRALVKHLIFVSAGQQWDDQKSDLTGQPKTYKNGFTARSKSHYRTIQRGLAHQAIDRMGWSPGQTFVGLAFDPRFNIEFSKNEKGDIVNAYYNWLKGKFDRGQIKSIYLAGHSRGGCLVARLGELFVSEFPNVPVIVQPFDGVCSRSGGLTHSEFGVTTSTIQNPLTPGGHQQPVYRAFKTNISARFSSKANLAFFNQVSGDYVWGHRAFTHSSAFGQFYDSGGNRPWLEQRWFNVNHVQIDNDLEPALDHLERTCAALGC